MSKPVEIFVLYQEILCNEVEHFHGDKNDENESEEKGSVEMVTPSNDLKALVTPRHCHAWSWYTGVRITL